MARNKKPTGILKNIVLDEEDFNRELEDRNKIQDIIIACEDKVSAPTYFRMIVENLINKKIITQDSLVIAKPHNTHPTGVLEDLKNHVTDEGKSYNEFDHQWIVIDRDKERVGGGGHTKEDFNTALSSAQGLDIEVAYANDSFELWYFLHFNYTDASISRDDVLKKVINHFRDIDSTLFAELNEKSIKTEKYTKLIFDILLKSQANAIINAEKLLQSYELTYNPENDSSTTIHKLINVLNNLSGEIQVYETKFCRVEYSKKYKAVLCTWKKFCQGRDYRNPLEYGLKILKETKCETWITDTQNGFESKEDDTKWLAYNFMPQVNSTSCSNLYFIMQKESLLKDEIEAQVETLKPFLNVEIYENFKKINT